VEAGITQSIWLATGLKVWVSNPGGGQIFRTRPDRLWSPPSFLYNGYRLKRPRRCVDHPPTSSAEVKVRVVLYPYTPSGPSWPALGWTLPFNFSLVLVDGWIKLCRSSYSLETCLVRISAKREPSWGPSRFSSIPPDNTLSYIARTSICALCNLLRSETLHEDRGGHVTGIGFTNTACSFIQNLTVPQLVMKFFAFYGTPLLMTVITTARYRSLSCLRAIWPSDSHLASLT